MARIKQSGPPLIIVPATVSLIRQWLPLTQFMGQRFTSYFFELPGHGGSTPYPEKFNSDFVPTTVQAFVDNLGYDKFNLMGFSFGGLLALRTLEHLRDRIDKVILLSPCVSKRALKWSTARQWAFKASIEKLFIHYGSSFVQPMLQVLYQTDNRSLRHAIMRQLHRMGPVIQGDLLTELKRNIATDGAWFVKRNLLQLLSENPPPELIGPLQELISEGQPKLFELVNRCLFRIQHPEAYQLGRKIIL